MGRQPDITQPWLARCNGKVGKRRGNADGTLECLPACAFALADHRHEAELRLDQRGPDGFLADRREERETAGWGGLFGPARPQAGGTFLRYPVAVEAADA